MTLTHYGLREWGSAFVIMVLLLAGAWYLAFRMGCMRTGIAVAAVSVFLFLYFWFRISGSVFLFLYFCICIFVYKSPVFTRSTFPV